MADEWCPSCRVHASYELVSAVASGAMGAVWAARSRTSGASVAIKFLRPDASAELRSRFDREEELLRQFQHPHVVGVLDAGRHEPHRWLVLELVAGGTLRSRLEAPAALDWRDAALLGADLLAGLAALHVRNIQHRDVKPANVLLTAGAPPRAKLADLGIARDETRDTRVTMTGALLGTPLYLPPEVLIHGEPWTAAGDVYSAGATLFECLAGESLVAARSLPDIVAELEAAPRVLERLRPVPAALAELVARAVARRPDERPRDAGAFLARWLAAVPDLRWKAADATPLAAQATHVPAARAPESGLEVTHHAPPRPAAPPLPETLNRRYRVLGPLGEGGMARVLEAEHRELGKRVAVKLPRLELLRNADDIGRFLDEARIAAMLNHPAIVRVIDFDAVDGTPYIVYELVPGKTLRERIAAGPLNALQALEVAATVCSALEEAHGKGVLHRDVKPENLIAGEDGAYKLGDFGIAKWTESVLVTATGSTPGTPLYMAPEVFAGQRATAASDLYSVGVVLFEMLAGRPPFEGGTTALIMERQLKAPPPRVSAVVPKCPPVVDFLVSRLMAKDPAGRPASAAEASSMIAEALTLLTSPAPRERPAMRAALLNPPVLPDRVPPMKVPRWFISLGLILIAWLVGVWVSHVGQPPPPAPVPSGARAHLVVNAVSGPAKADAARLRAGDPISPPCELITGPFADLILETPHGDRLVMKAVSRVKFDAVQLTPGGVSRYCFRDAKGEVLFDFHSGGELEVSYGTVTIRSASVKLEVGKTPVPGTISVQEGEARITSPERSATLKTGARIKISI